MIIIKLANITYPQLLTAMQWETTKNGYVTVLARNCETECKNTYIKIIEKMFTFFFKKPSLFPVKLLLKSKQ